MSKLYLHMFFTTFFFFGFVMPYDVEYNNEPQYLPITKRTYLTFRRYYFIARLDKTIRLLLKAQATKKHNLSRTLQLMHINSALFNNKRIIHSLQRIKKTQNLKPLLAVWDDFTAYKSLEDEVFIEDFSKEVFVVTYNVLSSYDKHASDTLDSTVLQVLNQQKMKKTEMLLNAIDEITHELEKVMIQTSQEVLYIQKRYNAPLDLKTEVTTDEIVLRFYYLQRLNKAMEIICERKNLTQCHLLKADTLFRNSIIQSLIKSMQETGTTDTITQTWEEIKEYKYIDNMEFVKEFIRMIFMILNAISNTQPQNQTFDSLNESTNSMDIEDLLHAVDIITDQLSTSAYMHDSYDAKNSYDWLQHYWWVPPLTVGAIAARLTYYYYTR